MSLLTGNMLHRYSWGKLNISADAVQRVKAMAEEEGYGLVGANFKYSYSLDGDDIAVDNLLENEQATKSCRCTVTALLPSNAVTAASVLIFVVYAPSLNGIVRHGGECNTPLFDLPRCHMNCDTKFTDATN